VIDRAWNGRLFLENGLQVKDVIGLKHGHQVRVAGKTGSLQMAGLQVSSAKPAILFLPSFKCVTWSWSGDKVLVEREIVDANRADLSGQALEGASFGDHTATGWYRYFNFASRQQ